MFVLGLLKRPYALMTLSQVVMHLMPTIKFKETVN